MLQAYVETPSESAFAELVERNKGLVYASALRQTTDPGLAGEITQAVFVVPARTANTLNPATILSGWLFRARCFATADALKVQRRRVRPVILQILEHLGLPASVPHLPAPPDPPDDLAADQPCDRCYEPLG